MTDTHGKKIIVTRADGGEAALTGGGWEIDDAGLLRIFDDSPTSTTRAMVAAYSPNGWMAVAFADAFA